MYLYFYSSVAEVDVVEVNYGHMFFYNRKQKKIDPKVMDWCVSKENCRRKSMLQAIGSNEVPQVSSFCCDVCNVELPASKLSFESLVAPVKRKRRAALRTVNEDLEAHLRSVLLKEREAYMQEHPSFNMIGAHFVCSLSTITSICEQACFIKSTDDLAKQFGLCTDLCSRFLNVIMCELSTAPVHKKSRRK